MARVVPAASDSTGTASAPSWGATPIGQRSPTDGGETGGDSEGESYNERSDECANMAPTGDGKDATGTGTGSGTE